MATNKKARQQARREEKQKAQRTRRLIGALVAGAFVALVVYFTVQQSTGSNTLPAESVADPVLGVAAPEAETDESSIIEIVEYSDFGCPACRGWHNSGIRDRLMTEYGDRIRFVWRDFPVITAQSPQAAEAGHCASAQGLFWEFHDHVYENFDGLDRGKLTGYAAEVGADVNVFETCMDERQMLSKVRSNEQEARRLGLRGTPGFAVNGQVVTGAPSFEILASVIESAN